MLFTIESYSENQANYIFREILDKIPSFDFPTLERVLKAELLRYLKISESIEFYEKREKDLSFIVADDNYGKVFEVYHLITYWKLLTENAGYPFKITDVSANDEGSSLLFIIDDSQLSENQRYFAFNMIEDEEAFKVF